MPFSKQNHIQHEICMFVSTGRVGSRTRILSNDLAGAATPVVIIVSLTCAAFAFIPWIKKIPLIGM